MISVRADVTAGAFVRVKNYAVAHAEPEAVSVFSILSRRFFRNAVDKVGQQICGGPQRFPTGGLASPAIKKGLEVTEWLSSGCFPGSQYPAFFAALC